MTLKIKIWIVMLSLILLLSIVATETVGRPGSYVIMAIGGVAIGIAGKKVEIRLEKKKLKYEENQN